MNLLVLKSTCREPRSTYGSNVVYCEGKTSVLYISADLSDYVVVGSLLCCASLVPLVIGTE